jgi:hypothetical protein
VAVLDDHRDRTELRRHLRGQRVERLLHGGAHLLVRQ